MDNGPEATITSGGTTVLIYDVAGPVDVDPANVKIKFASDDGVRVIKLTGKDVMAGLGLVIDSALPVRRIRDARRGPAGAIAFIASTAKIKSAHLKGGADGYNLNGLTLGPVAFAADVDGDTDVTDTQALFGSAGAGKIVFGGPVSGDVWMAPGSVAIKQLLIKGDYHGEMSILGDAGKIMVTGGNLHSRIGVYGDLQNLMIKARKGAGGRQTAGATIFVQGLLRSGTIASFDSDNADVGYGIDVGALGKLKTGGAKLTQDDLPFRDDDYGVALD